MEATVIYEYTANSDDELNLTVGDELLVWSDQKGWNQTFLIIETFYKKVLPLNEDWCRAKVDGLEGFAPIEYLNIKPYR